jgi:peptidoglycan hydrolase-like protein with peptidoglycan-binding domain
MPTLQQGSTGAVVKSLQQVLSNGAPGQWNTSPGAIDGNFGAATAASVKAFQTWAGVTVDGIVGDQTWAVSLHAASATLESAVGLQYAV